MLQKAKGIVLYSIKYSETSIISHIYTDNFGKQSFLSYGSKRRKGKVASFVFHPLSLIEFEADFKENREVQKIVEARFEHIFNQLYSDVRRSTIAIFLGEILNRNIRETEPNIQLFKFIHNAVQLLDIAEAGIENFHLVFLIQLTKFLGFFPGTDYELRIDTDLKQDFNSLIHSSLTELNGLKLSNDSRQKLLDLILNIYKQHLSGTGNIQSLKILREVFD